MSKLISKIKHAFIGYNNKHRLIKDVQVCEIQLVPAKYIGKGKKVITVRGIGSIIGVKENQWITIGLGYGRENNIVEHKKTLLKQYVVKFKDPITREYVYYPLSFHDYKYMNPLTDIELGEVFISDRKYAKLSDQEIIKREYLSYFNTNARGKDILRNLKENNFIIKKEKLPQK